VPCDACEPSGAACGVCLFVFVCVCVCVWVGVWVWVWVWVCETCVFFAWPDPRARCFMTKPPFDPPRVGAQTLPPHNHNRDFGEKPDTRSEEGRADSS
jgi:hypothetical protein